MKEKLSKELLKTFKEKAVLLCSIRNPYIFESTMFYKDMKPIYLFGDGKIYSLDELNTEYIKTALHDIKAGYRERKIGYYDKWYRYSRSDSGAAYDAGAKIAAETLDCPEMTVIECIH